MANIGEHRARCVVHPRPRLGRRRRCARDRVFVRARARCSWPFSKHCGLRPARVRRRGAQAALGLGWPLGLQFLLEIGAFATLVAILARVGQVDLAAHHVALQLVHFAFLPGARDRRSGVGAERPSGGCGPRSRGAASSPGADCGWRARTPASARSCSPLRAAAGLRLQRRPRGAGTRREAALRGCRLSACDGANVVARGVLRGAGDVRFSALLSVLTAWVTTPPLTLLLGVTLGLGAFGGWLGLCAEIMLGAAVLWHRWVAEAGSSAAQRSRRRAARRSAGRRAGAHRAGLIRGALSRTRPAHSRRARSPFPCRRASLKRPPAGAWGAGGGATSRAATTLATPQAGAAGCALGCPRGCRRSRSRPVRRRASVPERSQAVAESPASTTSTCSTRDLHGEECSRPRGGPGGS